MTTSSVKTSLAAPERSLDQRMEALKRANDIRTARAKLKKDLKAGRAGIHTILLDRIPRADPEEAIVEAWLSQAPKRVAAAYLGG